MSTRSFPTQVVGPVEGSRVVRFVLNTSAKDRDGTIFPPQNCDATNYLRNPVFTWGHAELQGATRKVDPDEVIGRALAVEIQRNPDRLVLPIEFRDGSENPLAEKCFQAVKKGWLSATSITALPKGTHKEGGAVVADQWELWAATLCIVGSNPEALALRMALSLKGRSMDKAAMYQALGLSDGATYDECLHALVNKLAGDSPENQQLALAVMSMGALGTPGGAAPSEPSDPVESAPVDMAAPTDDPEVMAMRAVIDAQRAELAARAAAAPVVVDSEKWADEQIAAQKWLPSGRSILVEIHKKSPEAAARSVDLFKPGSLPARRDNLSTMAPALVGRSAPNFGADPQRIPAPPAPEAKTKDDAKGIFAKRDALIKKQLEVTN